MISDTDMSGKSEDLVIFIAFYDLMRLKTSQFKQSKRSQSLSLFSKHMCLL